MAYQKLQVERALAVVASNSINIPNVAGPTVSGTTSQAAPAATQLVDATKDFTAIQGLVGSIVYVGKTVATVASVSGTTTLTLSDGIMSTIGVDEYVIYADENKGCVLYVGNTGSVRVLTVGNDDVTFVGIPAGSFVPVQVKRVLETGTDADDIVALW